MFMNRFFVVAAIGVVAVLAAACDGGQAWRGRRLRHQWATRHRRVRVRAQRVRAG
jgi:hypothetical protein